jgi:Uma2 family endonuclease
MAGGSARHSAIKVRVTSHVFSRLDGRPSQAFDSDLRVKVLDPEMVAYPDLSVACPPFEWDPDERHTLLNPVLLVEVGSPSTQNWDRGRKFEHYRQIPSLRHYVFVSSGAPHVEHHARTAEGRWLLTDLGLTDRLEVPDLGISLPIEALYANLPDEPSEPATPARR